MQELDLQELIDEFYDTAFYDDLRDYLEKFMKDRLQEYKEICKVMGNHKEICKLIQQINIEEIELILNDIKIDAKIIVKQK